MSSLLKCKIHIASNGDTGLVRLDHIPGLDEKVKHLRYFADTDAAITWLFLEGRKEAARTLNTAKKGK